MLIDCDSCAVRGLACSDCVVTVILGAGPSALGGDERQAIGVLADAGLVPPLRLVVTDDVSDSSEVAHVEEPANKLPEGFARARSAG